MDEVERERRWLLVDAEGKTLGRLASSIAYVLQGKGKPFFTRHQDVGDFVVVVNAAGVRLTGNKLRDKTYYRYTGYIGGLKAETAGEVMKKRPEWLITHAVSGMLPKNKLRARMLKRLKVYADKEHPHAAQSPEPVALQ